MALTVDDVTDAEHHAKLVASAKVGASGKANRPLHVTRAIDVRLDVSTSYLLKGLIHPGDVSVWYGPSGCGKTFLALRICHAIATGTEVLQRRVRQAPVVYVGLEGSAGLSKRVLALQGEYGDAADLFICREPLTLFQNPEAVQAVIATIKACNAELVWFDTLSRTMSGADENSFADMSHMVGAANRVQHGTGAHVAWTHHTGKDESRGARGHNSLRAAIDVEVEIAKSGTARTLRIAKGRDDKDGDSYGFDLKVVDLGPDADGDHVTSCVACELQHTPSRAGPALKPDERGWLDDIRAVFAEPGAATLAQPAEGMSLQHCMTRDALRAGLQSRGRIGVAPDVALSSTDRSHLLRFLNRLKDKGKLYMNGKFVWLTE